MVGFAEGELASLWRLCVVVLVGELCGFLWLGFVGFCGWVLWFVVDGFCGFWGVMFVVLGGVGYSVGISFVFDGDVL